MKVKEKNNRKRLEEKIRNKSAKICIIGLGYVGLPLVIEFAKAGFFIYGIDDNLKRVRDVNSGINYIVKKDSGLLNELIKNKKIKATCDHSVINKSDIIIICVPTPLTKFKQPDISYVETVSRHVSEHIREGQLIILESTTYPGTTEEILLPMFDKKVFKAGKNYFLAFSPERVDPGNKDFNTANTAKIIGGVTKNCSELTKALYEEIISDVYSATSPRTAEMTKLLENIFRCVNIALVNELALLCKRMNINIWEVVELASTKPYCFMPFYPGPGLGGHCIPIDPFYLTWKAKEFDFQTKFIELAGEINLSMPYFIVNMVQDALSSRNKTVSNSRVLLLGMAYKKDIDDPRESPAIKIYELLARKDAKVDYNDDFVKEIIINDRKIKSVSLDALDDYDCVVITTDHTYYDIKDIVKRSKLLVDSRNASRGIISENIFIL